MTILPTIILIATQIFSVYTVRIPDNPCPQIFNYYRHRNGSYFGQIILPYDGRGILELGVNVSLVGIYNKPKLGLILETPKEDLRHGGRATYQVVFPAQDVLPKVTKITFNGVSHCNGPPEPLQMQGVTNLWAGQTVRLYTYTIASGLGLTDNTISTQPYRYPYSPSYNADRTTTYPTNPSPYRRNPYEPTYYPDLSEVTTVRTNSIPYRYGHVQHNRPTSTHRPPTYTRLRQDRPSPPPYITPRPPPTYPEYSIDYNQPRRPGEYTNTINRFDPGTVDMNINMEPVGSSINSKECGMSSDVQHLVINGVDAAEHEYPWLVAMFKRSGVSYQFQCTANLITMRHVITSAHCVQFYKAPLIPKEDLIFVLGKSNLTHWVTSGATIRTAKEVMVHPEYKQYSGHGDIAIISFMDPVAFSKSIKPICLWTSERTVNGVIGTVAGWGKDESGSRSVPNLKKVDMPMVTQETCLRSNFAFNNLTSSLTFCAGERNGSGPCTGDSGAAYMVKRSGKWVLRGLVSTTILVDRTRECSLRDYVVFADIAQVLPWIESTLNKKP